MDSQAQQLRRDASDPQAAVALLRQRVRAGEVSQAMLELAAYCGHEGARELDPIEMRDVQHFLPKDSRGDPSTARFHLWLRGLERWPDALLRAVLAVRPWAVLQWPVGPSRYGWASVDSETQIQGIQSAPKGNDQAARQAICKALCEWALGGEA